jgi:hypothetical protein
MSRDLNAVLNIMVKGREIGKGLSEFRPVEEKATVPSYEMVNIYPMKQEASLLVDSSLVSLVLSVDKILHEGS